MRKRNNMQMIDEVKAHGRFVGESIKFDKDDFVIDWRCARNPL